MESMRKDSSTAPDRRGKDKRLQDQAQKHNKLI